MFALLPPERTAYRSHSSLTISAGPGSFGRKSSLCDLDQNGCGFRPTWLSVRRSDCCRSVRREVFLEGGAVRVVFLVEITSSYMDRRSQSGISPLNGFSEWLEQGGQESGHCRPGGHDSSILYVIDRARPAKGELHDCCGAAPGRQGETIVG